jgi:hypothetical protein
LSRTLAVSVPLLAVNLDVVIDPDGFALVAFAAAAVAKVDQDAFVISSE